MGPRTRLSWGAGLPAGRERPLGPSPFGFWPRALQAGRNKGSFRALPGSGTGQTRAGGQAVSSRAAWCLAPQGDAASHTGTHLSLTHQTFTNGHSCQTPQPLLSQLSRAAPGLEADRSQPHARQSMAPLPTGRRLGTSSLRLGSGWALPACSMPTLVTPCSTCLCLLSGLLQTEKPDS